MSLRNTHLEEPLTVTTHMSIVDVARLLRDHKRRHAYVLDEKEFPVGIISVTDINNRVVAENANAASLHAKDVMTHPIHMMEIDNDPVKAYFEMIAHDTLAVPVIDNGVLIGVLSLGEALRASRHEGKQKE